MKQELVKEKKDVLAKILAVVGTVLVWLPILATLLFSVAAFITERVFRFDYLMPAELFLAILVGGSLLIWPSLRMHSQQRLVGWGLGIAVGSLLFSQLAAVATGLASGETEPTGWPWLLVLTSLIIYILSIVVLGIGGTLLLNDLFNPSQASVKSH